MVYNEAQKKYIYQWVEKHKDVYQPYQKEKQLEYCYKFHDERKAKNRDSYYTTNHEEKKRISRERAKKTYAIIKEKRLLSPLFTKESTIFMKILLND
jgi:hypothetical protein